MTMRMTCLCLLLATCSAPAAVVYEPVQYQYQNQYRTGPGPIFYYGGSDPAVFQRMDRLGFEEQGSLGVREGAEYYGLLQRSRWNWPDYVFTDRVPWTNAALYGFGPANARTEAYENVPRYFRKADLLAAGVVTPDGSVIIPAQAVAVPQISIKPYNPSTHAAPHPILIIPRRALMPVIAVAKR